MAPSLGILHLPLSFTVLPPSSGQRVEGTCPSAQNCLVVPISLRVETQVLSRGPLGPCAVCPVPTSYTLALLCGLCLCSSYWLGCFALDVCKSQFFTSFRPVFTCNLVRESFPECPSWKLCFVPQAGLGWVSPLGL